MRLPNLSHKHIAEAVIVILLLGILLAIFIPKFMDAQVSTKIAQAKIDLQRIIQKVDMPLPPPHRCLKILNDFDMQYHYKNEMIAILLSLY